MEKNCTWHFDVAGRAITGPNDAIHETFKANPYYSIVRESIQNSMDAVLDENKPVKVVYSFDKIAKADYPNLFGIKDHIIACWQTHRDDKQAERLFYPMSSYIDKNSQIDILIISDYNTRGMHYDPSDINCPFESFLGEGKSSKNNIGSGGSFGFGKGAYYVLSKLRTLIVSTKTENENVYFEGRTRLATHKKDNKTYTRDGFYNEDCRTVSDFEKIPSFFKRIEYGTDIYIVGLIELEDRITQMIKSVLNNFWLAIHDNKLTVQIDNVEINKTNLESIIQEYFPNDFEDETSNEVELWNPRPYLKAVKYANANEQFTVFSESLKTLGEVKLYVYLEQGLPNKTSFLRKPRMVVFRGRRNNKVSGYAAVFFCEDEKGNEILKEMENPAHNEWEVGNYLNEDDKPHKDAKDAKKEISDFINRSLESLSATNNKKKLSVFELEEYLSIPEDLLDKEEQFDIRGDSTNTASGDISDEVTDEESPLQTTGFEVVKINPKVSPKQEVREDDSVEHDETGNALGASGGKNDTSGGDRGGFGDSDIKPVRSQQDNEETSKVLVNVGLKVAAQRLNGHLFHILIINTDREIENAELEVFVGADNEKDDNVKIVESDQGSFDNNTLKNVKLNYGKNLIKVRFADNLKHSVKMKTYELQ